MKLNKWTVGLAAVGLVSLASAARAEEKANMVATALSSTTLSGYVDTSMQWNLGTGNANLPLYKFNSASKADGFNLDVVQLRLEKPLDEAEWAAGYRVDLWAGPDANTLNTQSVESLAKGDFAIRQAYVALRMPVGNGIDWKVGVFDSIIGYESVESPNNPNYTRSYGHSIEPQTHTGVLATYRLSDMFSASAGVANTIGPNINSRAFMGSTGMSSGIFSGVDASGFTGSNAKPESYKTYMGSVAITAPDSLGFLSGSTLYGGVVNGFNNSIAGSGIGGVQTSYYLGATLATPVTGLRAGAAFDYLDGRKSLNAVTDSGEVTGGYYAWTLAGYLSFQATEKLSLHARAEYVEAKLSGTISVPDSDVDLTGSEKAKLMAVTGTVQYDLWRNVLSRVELRWDHSLTGDKMFGGTEAGSPTLKNSWMLAGNIIYKF
jgi:Putative beta-barrel porin-2, OmpL-like. bbp2